MIADHQINQAFCIPQFSRPGESSVACIEDKRHENSFETKNGDPKGIIVRREFGCACTSAISREQFGDDWNTEIQESYHVWWFDSWYSPRRFLSASPNISPTATTSQMNRGTIMNSILREQLYKAHTRSCVIAGVNVTWVCTSDTYVTVTHFAKWLNIWCYSSLGIEASAHLLKTVSFSSRLFCMKTKRLTAEEREYIIRTWAGLNIQGREESIITSAVKRIQLRCLLWTEWMLNPNSPLLICLCVRKLVMAWCQNIEAALHQSIPVALHLESHRSQY